MASDGLVRLKNDPGRQGVLTGRERDRRGITLKQVRFSDGTSSYVPDDQIELMGNGLEDPLDLLEAGRLGGAVDLRRALTHVRLTGRLANIIYSMDTTGTDFYAYQFKPVLKLLNSANSGLLIADEVGLGKTIEAGLIWTELRSRFDFRRIFVMCPAVLREKWQRELRQRFGVEADIVNARQAHARFERALEEGHAARFAMIGSMQGLRPRRGWDEALDQKAPAVSKLARFLDNQRHEEPLIDLAVIDEAHYLRNPGTMTTTCGQLLRSISDYILLLSATPVHLRNRDLFQLTNLIDPDTFPHPQAFDDILEANAPLVRLRDHVVAGHATATSLREGIDEARRDPLLRGNRQLEAIRNRRPTDDQLKDHRFRSHLAYRLETANLLGHIVTRTRKRDVTEWRVVRDVTAEEVRISDTERRFYNTVTRVVREYCEKTAGHEGFLLVTPDEQDVEFHAGGPSQLAEPEVSDQEEIYDDVGIDASAKPARTEVLGPLLQELMSRVDEMGDLQELWNNDTKYRRLLKCLASHYSEHPDGKVVIFAYFRPTLEYLRERLTEDGIQAVVLKGGVEDKDAVIREFRDRRGPIVLLSSEVGSEGIDLQFAWVVINYDLPWNPMRVEQRIGRVDRLGQASPKVAVWNLFCEDTIDARIYSRLFARLEIFTRALGALEPVLGERVRGLTMELLRNHLNPAEEDARIEQTRRALENIRQEEETLEENAAHLVAYGDYILNHVKAARELHRKIDGRDIQSYILDYFELHFPGCQFRKTSEEEPEFLMSLSNEAKHAFERFLREERLEGLTQLVRNDRRAIPCRFENTAIPQRGGQVELISQFHPLVRFVGRQIADGGHQYHPSVSLRLSADDVPDGIELGIYVFSVQRWSLQGLQDIERLHFAAVPLEDRNNALHPDLAERLVGAAAVDGKEWLGADDAVDLPEIARIANDVCLADSDEAFSEFVDETRAQNEDRADVQERTLKKHCDSQMATLHEVLQRHRQRGREALAKATEGRIRALESRVERKRMDIADRRMLKEHRDEISVGVIEVVSA